MTDTVNVFYIRVSLREQWIIVFRDSVLTRARAGYVNGYRRELPTRGKLELEININSFSNFNINPTIRIRRVSSPSSGTLEL